MIRAPAAQLDTDNAISAVGCQKEASRRGQNVFILDSKIPQTWMTQNTTSSMFLMRTTL